MSEPVKNEILSSFNPFFEPKTIAVVGASRTRVNLANRFIRRLISCSFPGEIYPVHPSAEQIEGLSSFGSLSQIPENIDYAFIAISAGDILPLLLETTSQIKFAHIVSSGFSDSASGADLEFELVKIARKRGIRIVGPNCMGLHSPRGKMALADGPLGSGQGVGLVSQSGGLALDILRHGRQRGVEFSALVSAGNCADVSVLELVEYFLADENTRIIALYIEQINEGRKFFETLVSAKAKKPVVILKGGRSKQGQRAAASHTGALIDDARLWDSFVRQTGSVSVNDITDMVDMLVGFQSYIGSGCPGVRETILFGNGGGASVIAADLFADCEISLAEFDSDLESQLNELDLGEGVSLENPIDIPANVLTRNPSKNIGKLLELVFQSQQETSLVVHLNVPVLAVYERVDLLEEILVELGGIQKSAAITLHLILRTDQDPVHEELLNHLRMYANKLNIPTFSKLPDSAAVLKAISGYHSFRSRHS